MYVHLHTNSSHFRNEQVYSMTPASDGLYRKAYRILPHSHTNRMKGLYGAGSGFPSGTSPLRTRTSPSYSTCMICMLLIEFRNSEPIFCPPRLLDCFPCFPNKRHGWEAFLFVKSLAFIFGSNCLVLFLKLIERVAKEKKKYLAPRILSTSYLVHLPEVQRRGWTSNVIIMANPLQEPALETPPGVISQFPTTHSDEQAWFYVCATLSTVVPGILLLLRLYTKLRVVRKVDLTDCSNTIFKRSLPSRF